uniref:Beta-lactamase domain-containing protein 2-like n=1 Tax=Saccoglossus kowalevskii TaxID=10224 RepID=A0ABM0M5E6_SACKO|nr:PREDICTED: beta-lactamase domain-containing protein 2-like [Saccoglossus kowalevskii]
MNKLLSETTPVWEPGTAHGYHGMTFGWFLSYLIKHVDPKHRTIGQFLQEEIADNFGIDFFIGLPKEEDYRVAKSDVSPWLFFKMMLSAKYRPLGINILFRPNSLISRAIRVLGSFGSENVYQYRSLEIPSANGIGTARGLAKLYAILSNGGEWNGKRLLSNNLVKKFKECNEKSEDKVLCKLNNFCHGMHPHFLITGLPDTYTENLFGHYGHGGQGAFFDEKSHLSFAYITTKLSPYGSGDDGRYQALVKPVLETINKLKNK